MRSRRSRRVKHHRKNARSFTKAAAPAVLLSALGASLLLSSSYAMASADAGFSAVTAWMKPWVKEQTEQSEQRLKQSMAEETAASQELLLEACLKELEQVNRNLEAYAKQRQQESLQEIESYAEQVINKLQADLVEQAAGMVSIAEPPITDGTLVAESAETEKPLTEAAVIEESVTESDGVETPVAETTDAKEPVSDITNESVTENTYEANAPV
ncbi:hypothetical protein [Paenibacillus eucommiae]|uniref:Uncharacterized protein n=1 Tax=Paenibacillus eucommiae TaxID=1355755 RepID=A0ABS4JD20_9BACL|nr:hypothetical protein [Paenibacillus eucommiae]MBP1997105.1 hypothetical protein [Paenibacillus eucommiae]